jgi:hypothetical protein
MNIPETRFIVNNNLFLSTRQLAAIVGKTRATVNSLCQRGLLPCLKSPSRAYLIRVEDIEKCKQIMGNIKLGRKPGGKNSNGREVSKHE